MRELRTALAKGARSTARISLTSPPARRRRSSRTPRWRRCRVRRLREPHDALTSARRGGSAGHHANLFDNPADDRQRSADRAVQEFLARRAAAKARPRRASLYGRAWGDVCPTGQRPLSVRHETSGADRNRLRRASRRRSSTRMASRVTGTIRRRRAVLWNPDRRIFISYEDPQSLRLKARTCATAVSPARCSAANDDPRGDLPTRCSPRCTRRGGAGGDLAYCSHEVISVGGAGSPPYCSPARPSRDVSRGFSPGGSVVAWTKRTSRGSSSSTRSPARERRDVP